MLSDTSSPFVREILQQMLDGTTAGVVVLDEELRYTYVNPTLARMNGVAAADHLGRTMGEVLPGLDGREDVLRQVLADGVAREVMSSGHTRAGSDRERRYWHGAYHRLESGDRILGVVGIVLEVTDARKQQDDLEKARTRLTVLDRAATMIGTTLDMDTTCDELAAFLVSDLADIAAVEVVPQEADARRRPPASGILRLRRAAMRSIPGLQDYANEFGRAGEYIDYQPGAANPRCLADGEPIIDNLLPDNELSRAAPQPSRVEAYRAAGIHSALVVPLAARGEPIGTVSMIRAGDSPTFTAQDAETALALANRAAICLDNARRYTQEHHIALELQRALLGGSVPPHPGIEVASRYLPAGSSVLVGGDWFDSIPLRDGRTLLVIGDVMGHGIAAAVDMSHYAAMLRVIADGAPMPHDLLTRMDALIARGEGIRPATCLLAVADPNTGTCTYASAGHLPPAVLERDGRLRLLPVPAGPPLGTGVGGYTSYADCCGLEHTLLLYTDGLVERRDEDIDMSLQRLTDLRLSPDLPLEDLLSQILLDLASMDAEDDIAVLAARVLRPGTDPLRSDVA